MKVTRCYRQAAIAAVCCALALASVLWPGLAAAHKKKAADAVVRWAEGAPGCTFSRTADGRYHYGMWAGDAGITMAVDSQELEKVHRRHELFFSVALTVQYRGTAAIDLNPADISLEFVKHFKTVQTAVDPDGFAQKVQNDADALDHEIGREMEKHPEEKQVKQSAMQTFQKETAELLEFLSADTMKPSRLDSGNRVANGWVLFSADSKWIGGWKKQEEFILFVPIGGKVFEFPFKLPPKEGELLLRQR